MPVQFKKIAAGCLVTAFAIAASISGHRAYKAYQESLDPAYRINGHTEVRVNSQRVFRQTKPHFGHSVDFTRLEIADVYIIGKDTAHANIRHFDTVTDMSSVKKIVNAHAALGQARRNCDRQY